MFTNSKLNTIFTVVLNVLLHFAIFVTFLPLLFLCFRTCQFYKTPTYRYITVD